MPNNSLKLTQVVFDLRKRVMQLESQLDQLKSSNEERFQIQKAQIIKIKNNEEVSDEYIFKTQSYLDLSPEKAFEVYNNENSNFILIDVSSNDFDPGITLPEARKVEFDHLEISINQIAGKSTNILVISEDGLKSILACKRLNLLGYYNLTNISGGYAYWPAKKSLKHPKDNFKIA